ncbi:MAG: hypothetical protein A2275_10690 [Bacteroidetes bacterium RIFOXYA12_FULL_35_11]|nr:MAG: hypothetical protein A2X01_08575 [Bacteroidetes bacterium GWF2_35_48]OFY72744.1 MAG: hypothetical protein A2275_10690 [Bacteroidetes bacterium RIFOXYA12_FULL_35_11]OFY92804.1 MAG: hypothetical protein A2309_08395 [Bacteroidetes bacterium RIFOXYB2_FULL_35_7]HBX52464.1 DNA-binding response regulator [Bacteroidales bacterium]
MITCIIVDDEEDARGTLDKIIKRYFSDIIKTVALVGSVKDAVVAINTFKPELVFLDIEMPVENGFKLFDYLNTVNFDIIFTTAHSQYAIDAIKYSALDYLLKPINFIDLKEALKRLERKQVVTNNQVRIETLLYNLNAEPDKLNKIALPTQTGFQLEKISNIVYCEAKENYTKLFLFRGNPILISKTLKWVEEILPQENFFRLHKSYLVNLNYVKSFNRQELLVYLENGTTLELAVRRTDDFATAVTKKYSQKKREHETD